jgi:phosphotriesterase-related protein
LTIVTVNGPIAAGELGLTLAHEHIFCDTSGDFRAPPPHIESLLSDMGVDLEAEITLPCLGFLWREPQWSVSNQVLDSYEDAVE